MTHLVINQHNFNGGVIEPRMFSRVNTEAYEKGAAVLDNVVQIPQGGITRRGGLEYIDEIAVEARLVPFQFSTIQTYLLAFYVESGTEKMKVYKDGALVTTITITVATYTQSQMLDINWTQSADTLFIVHKDVKPISIVRGANDSTWTQTAVTLTGIPQFDFNDSSSPTPTSEVQDVTFGSAGSGDTYRLTLEGIVSESITWSATTADNTSRIEQAVKDISVSFPASSITVASVSATQYTITFSGSAAKDWEDIEINAIAGAMTLTHNTGSETDGVARSEDVWSATRGYPGTVTFHEGRFWFGGSAKRPQTLWGTIVNGFSQTEVDFTEGLALDADSINVTLDTDQVNQITSLVSGRHLQILTTGGEFAILKSPITPENIAVVPQSRFGSSSVRPISIDGATLFIQRTGRSLREYLFNDVEQGYTAASLSLLASPLLVTPVDTDALVGTSDDDANYVYVVNEDGTVAVFNTLRDQEVAGWTRFTTDGKFLRVGVDDQTTYFLVERVINSATKFYLEKLNVNCFTDSCTTYGAQVALITALSYLEGKTVRVKADGAVLGSELVTGNQITMDRASTESAEIGLDFNPTITTLPLNKETEVGSTLQRKTRVIRTSLHLIDSLGVHVDGELLPDRVLGTDDFDSLPEPFTGIKEHRSLGWKRLNQKTISQVDPLPMTLIGAEFTIKVNL